VGLRALYCIAPLPVVMVSTSSAAKVADNGVFEVGGVAAALLPAGNPGLDNPSDPSPTHKYVRATAATYVSIDNLSLNRLIRSISLPSPLRPKIPLTSTIFVMSLTTSDPPARIKALPM
jgi:hypothetical protein